MQDENIIVKLWEQSYNNIFILHNKIKQHQDEIDKINQEIQDIYDKITQRKK